jgi:hypothetical protein
MGTAKLSTKFFVTSIFLVLTFTILSIPGYSYAHGSEGHDENAFSNYDAVKKSFELFDKLLMKKKIGSDWERNFSSIIVSRSMKNDQKNIVVKMLRKKGDPASLYIFFDEKGKYKGSNFKGE